MVKYLPRACPKCGALVGIVVSEPLRKSREYPVNGFCLRCDYKVAWKLIRGQRAIGRKRAAHAALLRKVR